MLEKIATFIGGIILSISSFLGITTVSDTPIQEPTIVQNTVQETVQEDFGAFSPVAGGTYRLKTSIGTTDTTIILSSLTEPISGTPITMTTLASDIGYATIDPQSSTRKEFVSFTGITQNADGSATLSGVTRGLGFQSPFTAVTTLRKSHPGQSIFILSDSPQLFNEYARIRSNETITGQWTFSTFPITPSSTPATATTSGTVELATGGEAASSTITGDTSILALHTGISTSSAPSSGNVVVVTGDDGNIDSGFLDDSVEMSIRRAYTASTTWTKPSNLQYVIVQAWGAGGSGGSDDSAGEEASGGGGGAYVEMRVASSSLGATTSIVIGTGGALTSGANRDGNAGGTTSFGTFITAYGGGGGAGDTSDAGGGGGGGALSVGAVGGNSGVNGAAGSPGAPVYGTGNASGLYSGGGGSGVAAGGNVGGSSVYGGAGGGGCGVSTSAGGGGTSQLGGAGGAGDTSASGNATAGSVPGGGGGGKCGAAGNSGAGANGMLIITEYY